MKRVIIGVCFMVSLGAYGRARLAFVRATQARTEREEQAFQRVEKRWVRWVESNGWEAIRSDETRPALRQQEAAKRIRTWVSEAIVGRRELSMPDLEREIQAAGALADDGETAQWKLIGRAFLVAENKRDTVLSELARFHPEGLLPLNFDNEAEWSGKSVVFTAELQRRVSQVARNCLLKVSTEPEAALWLNGFEIGSRREFRVASGSVFRARLSAPGYREHMTTISCTGSQREVSLALVRSRLNEPAVGADAMLEVWGAIEEGNFHFSLADAKGEVVPLPIDPPATVTAVLEEGILRPLALPSLPVKRRLAQMRGLPEPLRPGDVVSPKTEWYNNWKLWGLAGGLAAGTLAAYLIVRPSAEHGARRGILLELQ